MMNHLPEPVAEQEIMEMFNYADKDRDGRINFEEFLVMITPVKVPDAPIIYAKPNQLNKNNKNTVLANGTADHEGPARLATDTQDISEVDKTKMVKGKNSRKISFPPPAPEEPVRSEKSCTQEITIPTTISTAAATATTESNNVPVATLVTTA